MFRCIIVRWKPLHYGEDKSDINRVVCDITTK